MIAPGRGILGGVDMGNSCWAPLSVMAVLAAVTAPPAMGQDGDILPVDGEWRERLDPPREVSQLPVAGFAVFSPLPATGPELRALLPADWRGGEICVHARSADGGYEAINTHLVPEDFTGPVGRLPFQTGHPDLLAGYGSETLAVLVTAGACARDSREIPDVTLAFWNARPELQGEAVLLMNSLRAERVFVYVGEGAASPIECTPAEADVRYSFDTRCAIPLDRLPEGRTQLSILAMRNQQFDPPQTFHVVRPGEDAAQ